MKTTRIITALAFCGLVLSLGAGGCSHFNAKPESQKMAERLADKMVDSLGGQGALDSMRFLTFDYIIEHNGAQVMRRSHTWDRKTGRYRMEGLFPDGKPYVALFNTNTHQGKVFVGEKLEPMANAGRAMDEIYQNYLKDTGWLMGLFRLRDPGVTLTDTGQAPIGGSNFEVLNAVASGPAAGTLPGEQNWIYLNPETGKPFAWSMLPAGQNQRVSYIFTKFDPVGKLQLPVRLERMRSPWAITFKRVMTINNIGDNVFSSVAEPLTEKVTPLPPGELPLPLPQPGAKR